MKYEKSNLIHIQTKDNLVILTHKIDTLITLTTFLKKCEKSKGGLHIGMKGVFITTSEKTGHSRARLFAFFIALMFKNY